MAEDFKDLQPFIVQLATVGKLACGPDTTKPKQSATSIESDFELYVSLEGLIDVDTEVKRLEKQLAEKMKHVQATRNKLSNSSFVDKAPAEVVQQQRELVADLVSQVRIIEDNLRDLRQG